MSRGRFSPCAGYLIAAGALLFAAGACDGESRPRPSAPPGTSERAVVMSADQFQAGPVDSSRPPRAVSGAAPADNPFEGDRAALAEGKRLYSWFNCAGCHGSQGGGGIGPPLRDTVWIYGGAPANVFQSIAQGRPKGMPTFGHTIPDEQVWQIVSFVRSLSGDGRSEREGSETDSRSQ